MSVLLVVGDSIAYGHWDRRGGWTQRLRSFLERRSLEREHHYELNTTHYVAVYNLGIPGDTTEGVLKRFDHEVAPRLDSDQDTIIIFAVGINDSHFVVETNAHKVSVERFSKNLLLLLDRAKRVTDKIFFVGLTPVDEYKYALFRQIHHQPYKNQYVRKYDAEIRNVCTTYGVDFIDVLDAFYKSDYENLLEDGIHPNDKGHELLEGIIREQLLKKAMI